MSALQEKRNPAGGPGFAGGQTTGRGLQGNHSTAGTALLLDRLECVRKSGRGWIARCPAHGDKRPSLSLAEGDDGRVLLHCFGGCSAASVVHAVGLTLGDLFPARLDRHMDAAGRRKVEMETRIARRWAAIGACLPELALVEVAASQMARGEPLSASDAQRVSEAHETIHRARLTVQGGIR